jgi:hypothetical protein
MRLIVSIALLAALAAVPATAGAKADKNAIQQAEFKATFSGSQVTTWQHSVPPDEDPCTASSTGNGDQTIRFKIPSFKLSFIKPSKADPNGLGTSGRPAVTSRPIALLGELEAERNGDYNVNYGEIDQNNCEGVAGGGVDTTPEPKDCGERKGDTRMVFFFSHNIFGEENLLFPPLEDGRDTDKDRLKFYAFNYEWGPGNPGERAGSLDSTYKNCPWLLDDATAEREGSLYTSAEKLSEKALFGKRKRFTVSGHEIAKRGSGNSSGQTILAWNLRLTRVK